MRALTKILPILIVFATCTPSLIFGEDNDSIPWPYVDIQNKLAPKKERYAKPDEDFEGPKIADPSPHEPHEFIGEDVKENLDPEVAQALDSLYEDYYVVSMDIEHIEDTLAKSPYFFKGTFDLQPVQKFDVELVPNELRGREYTRIEHHGEDDSSVYEMTPYGVMISAEDSTPQNDNTSRHYKGFSMGDKDKGARLSVKDDDLVGFFHDEDGNKYQIQSMGMYWRNQLRELGIDPDLLNPNHVLITQAKFALSDWDLKCGGPLGKNGNGNGSNDSDPEPCEPLIFDVALAADFEFFDIHGNNSEFAMLADLNMAEHLFSSYFNLRFAVPHLEIEENETDQPYQEDTDGADLLEEFRDFWNFQRGHVDRDAAHLYSGKGLPGIHGIAYMTGDQNGVVCDVPNLSYSLTEARALTHSYKTTAHEFGHLFGSLHTDDDYGHHAPCDFDNAGNRPIMCQEGRSSMDLVLHNTPNDEISSHIDDHNQCLRDGSDPDVADVWLQSWQNTYSADRARIGTWRLSEGDIFKTGDFNGNGHEEILFMSEDDDWATLMKFDCDYGTQDWYHLWSNMGDGTIEGMWNLNISSGQRFRVGDFTGNGKDELFVISASRDWAAMFKFSDSDNEFNHVWSNNGDGTVSSWNLGDPQQYVVGDFTDNGEDQILFLEEGNSAVIYRFSESNNEFQSQWWNNNSGEINSRSINTHNKFIAASFSENENYDELMVLPTNLGSGSNWVSRHRFESNNNDWTWLWTNSGADQFMGSYGWDLPFRETDNVLSGDIDDDQREELMFVQGGSNANWAVSHDFPPNNNNEPMENWHNNGVGHIEDPNIWNLNDKGDNYTYFTVKPNPELPKQVFLIAWEKETSWFSSTTYDFEAKTYRTTLDKNMKRDPTALPEQDEKEESLTIYPNPSPGVFKIEFPVEVMEDNGSLSVYDISGRKVYDQEIKNPNPHEIDLSGYSEGMYFLKFENGDAVFTENLLIK